MREQNMNEYVLPLLAFILVGCNTTQPIENIELQRVKDNVDARVTYVYFKSDKQHMLTAKPVMGKGEGNCWVFAITYKHELDKLGEYKTAIVANNTRYGGHAWAEAQDLATGQIYVLDNYHEKVMTLDEHKWLMY
jgi:hypothetical protein